MRSRLVEMADRWAYSTPPVITAEAAWTADGARQLADLLPDEFTDLRQELTRSFGVHD